nr:MAG TPA: hypothetical protein [Caudoviricetes sp.]
MKDTKYPSLYIFIIYYIDEDTSILIYIFISLYL